MFKEQDGIQVDKFYPPEDWQYSFPEGYTRLEYLTFTGVQYIELNFKANQDTRVITEFSTSKYTQNQCIFSSRSSYQSNEIGTFVYTYNNQHVIRNNYKSKINDTNIIVENNTYYNIDFDKNLFYVNGQLVTTNTYDTFQATYNMCLGRTAVGTVNYFYGNLKQTTIFDNGTLVFNLVPAKRNSDNKPGMYDLVNNVFYVNQGSGVDFTMGPELYKNKTQIDLRSKVNMDYPTNYEFNSNDELTWVNPDICLIYSNGEKHYGDENIAVVPAGLAYNNTTTPSIGYVDMRTQVFTPAPEGATFKRERKVQVVAPEDNTITLLYGVKSDFSKYALFGLLASVSSGTYDVYIDDVLYATTASGTQTDIDFSTLGSEYVSIGTCTTPESLVLHKIVIKPNTSGETITKFRCALTDGATGTQRQGLLWCHFEIDNDINFTNLFNNSSANQYVETILLAHTAKNDIITMEDGQGIGPSYRSCEKIIYIPYIKNKTQGQSQTFQSANSIKRLRLDSKAESGNLYYTFGSNFALEQINIKNKTNKSILTTNSFSGNRKLKLLPFNVVHGSTLNNTLTQANELYPTKIDATDGTTATVISTYGTSTYPMRGLQGLKVSDEAPFNGTSPQINVSYTGLGRDELVELFNSMPGYMKLTAVGSPTITNGVVSGFSASDYLITQQNFNPQNNKWEMVFKFTVGSTTSNQSIVCLSGKHAFTLYQRLKSLEVLMSSNGSSWDMTSSTVVTVTSNSTYIIKIEFTGNNYKIYSFENNSWVLKKTITSSNPIYSGQPFAFGTDRAFGQAFSGSIDLNNSYIKINNARYQFQLPDDTTSRAINITATSGNNLTLSGNATIDSEGTLSNMDSSSSCITPSLPAEFRTMEMLFKVRYPNAASSSYIPIVGFGGISSYRRIGGNGSSGHNLIYSSSVTLIVIPLTDFNFVEAAKNGYYVKLNVVKDGSNYKYKLSLSIDKITWVSKEAISEYNVCSGTITLLRTVSGAAGGKPQMFLEETYIKVDNNYFMKGYLLDSDRAIVTNKGWSITG